MWKSILLNAVRRLPLLLALAAASAAAQTPPVLAVPNLDVLNNGIISAVARQPDGGIVIGGEFTQVGGVRRVGLARLLPDGTLDANWNPDVVGMVYALAIGTDGAVYAGGYFYSVGGQVRSNIVKLHSSGSVDPLWDANVSGSVYAMQLAGDALYIGGDFNQVGGQPRNWIAKVSASGSGAVDLGWNAQADNSVRALAVAPGGWLYAGGWFNSMGGVPRDKLAKLPLGGSGNVDPDWNPGAYNLVRAIAVDAAGAVYVGGDFTGSGGELRRRIARLDGAGTGAADASWNPNANAPVHSLALDASGNLYVGGTFTSIGGQVRNRIARLATTGAGAADPGWDPGSDGLVAALALDGSGVVAGGRFSLAAGAPRWSVARLTAAGTAQTSPNFEQQGFVYALARTLDGGTLVGGSFLGAGGQMRRNLLRLGPNRQLDANWNPGSDGDVWALAVDGSGAAFAGGNFTRVGGVARNRIAKLAAAGSGAVDASWNPSADSWVRTLAVDASGAVYAGGSFYGIGGATRPYIAKLAGSGTGAADPAWNPAADGWVQALAVDTSGAVYAGGEFDTIGGQARKRIAKLSGSGSGAADAVWNPTASSSVQALAVGSGGAIYAGGWFTSIGGLPRRYLAKLSASGSGAADPAWDPSPENSVFALAPDGAGSLFVGGQFYRIAGQVCQSVAKLSESGSGALDPHWLPQVGYHVWALAVQPDSLLIGGLLESVGNRQRRGVAALPRFERLFADGFDDPPP